MAFTVRNRLWLPIKDFRFDADAHARNARAIENWAATAQDYWSLREQDELPPANTFSDGTLVFVSNVLYVLQNGAWKAITAGHDLFSTDHPDVDATDTPADGEVLTFVGGGVNKWQAKPLPPSFTEVRKTADEDVVNSTTLQDDDHLFFSVVANGVYVFEAWVICSSPAGGGTPDMQLTFAGPTGSTGMFYGAAFQSETDTAIDALARTLGTLLRAGTGTTPRVIPIRGWAVIGGTAGSVVFRWAQVTASANATRVHAGSVLRYRQLV